MHGYFQKSIFAFHFVGYRLEVLTTWEEHGRLVETVKYNKLMDFPTLCNYNVVQKELPLNVNAKLTTMDFLQAF